MYEFWYDYGKIKYGEKEILCYTTTDSFNVYIKQMKRRFATPNYELNSPLPKGKKKKIIVVMKD